jgi:transcriptional regulator with XRE-family HTH domain
MSDRIRSERTGRGWTQAELARRLAIGQQTISRWEQGRTRPDLDQVLRLLEVFDLDPAQASLWLALSDDAGPTIKPMPSSIRPLTPDLPIGYLLPEDFERFCREFIKFLHPHADVHRFGGQGHKQDGIDLYAQEPDGSITTYQCKRYKPDTDFGPSRVKTAMKANTIAAKHHYILLTRIASPSARKVVMGNPMWTLWDLEDISEVIREQLDPDARIKLVDRFFPGHREDFLGLPEPGPWLTAEQFFAAFDDRLKLLNHTWGLVGRRQNVDDLVTFSTATDSNRLALIIGPGGSGKSRVLRAVVDAVEAKPGTRVRFLLPGSTTAPGLVHQLPDGSSVLIIDDAHEAPVLDGLLSALAAQRPDVRVIAATRPYGEARIRSLALRANLAEEPMEVNLGELTVPEATALASEVLSAESFTGPIADVARNIAMLTRDCPLATVIGARLVGRGQILPQTVASDERFRRRLFLSFSEVLSGQVAEPGERDLFQSLLQFFALLQPLVPESPEFDKLLRLIVGKSHAELKRLLIRLEDAGVLIHRAGLVRLVPDVLADTIAEQVCIDERSGQTTGYVDQLFDRLSGQPLQNLLVNVGKLDWRLSSATGGVPAARLLDRVWAKLETRLTEADSAADRREILGTIAEVAYFQPERALELAAGAMNDAGLTGSIDPADVDPEALDLVDALVPVLRNVAYTYQCVGPATDLLWALVTMDRPAVGARLRTEPLRALQGIASYGPGKPVSFHEAVIERALSWLTDTAAPVEPSPFDVLDAFLATEGTEDSFDEYKITMRGFLVTAEVVRPLRERVIDAAFEVLENGSLQSRVRALKSLEGSLRFPMGLAGANPSNEQRKQWEPDHLVVLKRLLDLITSKPLEPLLYVEIRHVVRWHATYGAGETQEAARKVLAALPTDLASRVTHCLIEGSAWMSDDLTDDYQAGEIHHQQYQAETADQLLDDISDASAVIDYVRERLTVIGSVKSDRVVVPSPFLAAVIERDPNVARAVIKAVIADPIDLLGQVLSVALSQLAVTAPTEAVEHAQQLLAVESLGLDWQIAYAFSLGLGARTDLRPEEIALIESLAKHPDAAVRSLMVYAADNLAATQRARAVRLLLSIDFSDSAKVAGAVLGEFKGRVFRLDDLAVPQRKDLLKRLEVCPNLDEYAIGLFLRAVAETDAESMVAMLQARIARQTEGREAWLEGIPWAWSHAGQSPVILRDNPKFDRVLGQLLAWLSGSDALQAHYKTPLVKAIVGAFDDPTIALLRTWLEQHPGKDSLEAVSMALGEAQCSIIWTQQAFIVELLKAAEAFGTDSQQTVGRNLSKAAMSNSELGTTLGGQAASEGELITNARRIMHELPVGSVTRRFYRELADHVEQMTRWRSSSPFT